MSTFPKAIRFESTDPKSRIPRIKQEPTTSSVHPQKATDVFSDVTYGSLSPDRSETTMTPLSRREFCIDAGSTPHPQKKHQTTIELRVTSSSAASLLTIRMKSRR